MRPAEALRAAQIRMRKRKALERSLLLGRIPDSGRVEVIGVFHSFR
jgi:hypothetical protein